LLRRVLGVAPLLLAAAGAGAQSQNAIPPATMSQYVDAGFGFSFWYPAAWSVTEEPVADVTDPGWFQGGTIVRELRVANPRAYDDGEPPGVIVQELSAPAGFLTELGHSKSASPVGVDQKFFFDTKTQTWMDAMLSEAPDGEPPTTSPAVISRKTLGGQPILNGAKRHGADVIVPLNPTHFLVLSTIDPGGDQDEEYIAGTVAATGPNAVQPNSVQPSSTQAEADTIRRAGVKLGAIAQPLGYWYKDSEHVYDNEGRILANVDPKKFAPLAQNGPNAAFATDGIHVYASSGAAIPGADPNTFAATNLVTAKDAHHRYDWSGGSLLIDGVAVRK
jgi:hypothetical protein